MTPDEQFAEIRAALATLHLEVKHLAEWRENEDRLTRAEATARQLRELVDRHDTSCKQIHEILTTTARVCHRKPEVHL